MRSSGKICFTGKDDIRHATTFIKSVIKDSVTVRYIFVYCRFMSLFAKNLLG